MRRAVIFVASAALAAGATVAAASSSTTGVKWTSTQAGTSYPPSAQTLAPKHL